jgi:hypothetical protein
LKLKERLLAFDQGCADHFSTLFKTKNLVLEKPYGFGVFRIDSAQFIARLNRIVPELGEHQTEKSVDASVPDLFTFDCGDNQIAFVGT